VTFEEIVGQDSIARTLKNAIDANRTAHAYLFCGTRGVGKTSMARIFARTVNVSKELQEEQQINEAILRGEDLDVIEIDGASNRGVQEARDLIASAGLSPSRCKYRIYIIDEVHMLTTPAFNALLKTMEEPPSHVKFILCTTEPHKVPATIQSRCQRFDFRTIPSAKIADHLTYVLKEEGVNADPEIIAEVARLGDGSMRDALSILDRLLAGGATTITAEEMSDLLGLPSQKTVYAICDAISTSDMSEAFAASDELISSGISLDRILEVLAKTFRDALVARVCGKDTGSLELSDEARARTVEIGNNLDEATISHMIALCDATSRQVRRGGSGRAIFDATIARLCMTDDVLEAGGVLSKSKRSVTKKKSQTVKPQIERASTPVVKEINPNPQSIAPTEVTWDSLLTVIATTPGLKKVASYLILKSLGPNHLVLGVSEAGRETLQYIVAQRKMIEETISIFASRKITVEINASEVTDDPVQEKTISDQVEGNELVNAARGLFDGTVVNVKSTQKKDH
jgi:DNA polymerase-3 subunit gamma/tau